jgi:uncharacterized protein with PQ loop repeat
LGRQKSFKYWFSSGGFSQTISLLHQTSNLENKKSAKIFAWMFRLFAGGVILWFSYGIIVKDLPISWQMRQRFAVVTMWILRQNSSTYKTIA